MHARLQHEAAGSRAHYSARHCAGCHLHSNNGRSDTHARNCHHCWTERRRGPYADALAQGDNLPAAEADAIAAKLSAYIGLSAAYVQQANLRVSPPRFRKELMGDAASF